jgi:hypothetical protein
LEERNKRGMTILKFREAKLHPLKPKTIKCKGHRTLSIVCMPHYRNKLRTTNES